MTDNGNGDRVQHSGSLDNALATVASSGTFIFASKVVGLGFGFLTQFVMARLLTEAAYGDVVLTLAVVNVAALIAKLGMDDGVMRQFPQFEDEPSKAKGVVQASLSIAVGTGIVAAVVVFISAPIVARQLFNSTSLVSLLRLGAVSIPFLVTGNIAVSLARGARDAKPHAYVDQLARPSLRFAFIAILIIGGYGAVGAVAGQIVAVAIAGVLSLYFVSNMLPSLETTTDTMYRPVLEFSIPLMAFQGMGFLNRNFDIYMVGYFLDSSSVGVYNVALQLSNLLMSILLTIGFLLPPALTRLHKQDKPDEMQKLYQGLTKWIVFVSIPIFTVLFFAPELIIGLLFGSAYISGVPVLRILLVGLLFAAVMGLNNRALIGLGENRVVAYITLGQVLVNGTLNVLLIPIYGIAGAAIAMTASLVVGNVFGVAILNRDYDVHPFTRQMFALLASLGLVATVAYGVVHTLLLPLPLMILLVGISYPLVVVKVALGPEEELLFNIIDNQVSFDLQPVYQVISWIR